MDSIIEKLFADGLVGKESVKAFLKEKNDELKLFSKIQEICGMLRKSPTNISLIQTWRSWNFGDEMILESAKRSATSANPIPYMNKILSDWKRQEIFAVKDIPDSPSAGANTSVNRPTYTNVAIEAVNAKSDRERYYSLLREKAQVVADKNLEKANKSAEFKQINSALSKMEITLAKAEVFEPDKLPALEKEKLELLARRKEILTGLQLKESDLTPKFNCKKCSDTGFLPSGKACDCYKNEK